MRWGFYLAALSLLLVLACAIAAMIIPLPGQAAPSAPGRQQAGSITESQFLLLYPELRQAPAWLRPGVRVTYNSAFATFARDIRGLIGFYTEAHMLAGVQYSELAEE